MRKVIALDTGWYFRKNEGCSALTLQYGEAVTLPHTWNATDGQDGGNDYYRGKCWYVRKLESLDLTQEEEAWLEFDGVAMTGEVYLNDQKLFIHKGGYSRFRVNITNALTNGENILAVTADNGKNDSVYPQKADFTFYGGIYRNVRLLVVPKTHFALGYYGSNGIKITPRMSGKDAKVTVEAWIEGDADYVSFKIDSQEKKLPVRDGKSIAEFEIKNVHLWNGKKDPYLYTCKATMDSGDTLETVFGCRTIEFDPEKGFLLNGNPYRLCGASRHQDWEGIGNALTEQHYEEDIKIMLEMGANTVRLAHYQHDQYFYDLCDKYGMIVWTEIPYITEHLPNARENSLSQMKELIIQNYNHPSVVCWGLSNEITASGGLNEDLIENHRLLNELCHKLDATRPTTMAHVFMLNPDDPFVMLPDIRSYNLYYGWYVGEMQQNDEWFDRFHRKYPEAVIGLSEYGADANPAYQSANPEKGDWTEGYQALYHEHMLKMWSERPYIWAMHCWNMFDFGADGRDEGGKPGQNQKGLVTFDRKTRKDAFYIYKAYLSDKPFVHICGKRYINRCEKETEIKVYSNQPEVTLYLDDEKIAALRGDKIFRFTISIAGEHRVKAVAENFSDYAVIRHVEQPDSSYGKDAGNIVNWFDRGEEIIKPGCFSIMNTMAEIKMNSEALKVLNTMLAPLQAKAIEAYGDVAKNITLSPEVIAAMDRMSVESNLKQLGRLVTPEFVHKLNYELNRIKISSK